MDCTVVGMFLHDAWIAKYTSRATD